MRTAEGKARHDAAKNQARDRRRREERARLAAEAGLPPGVRPPRKPRALGRALRPGALERSRRIPVEEDRIVRYVQQISDHNRAKIVELLLWKERQARVPPAQPGGHRGLGHGFILASDCFRWSTNALAIIGSCVHSISNSFSKRSRVCFGEPQLTPTRVPSRRTTAQKTW